MLFTLQSDILYVLFQEVLIMFGSGKMEWLVSELRDLLIKNSNNIAANVWRKVKLRKQIKNLREKLRDRILNRYGAQIYYNDLDAYVSRSKVIDAIISNCMDTPPSQYKSKSMIVDYYISRFEELYPQYKAFHLEIMDVFQQYFNIIFETLNQSKDENVRVVGNIAKELAGEMSSELNAIVNNVKVIDKKLDMMINNSPQHVEDFKFLLGPYLQYISALYPSYSTSGYISRAIYPKDNAGQLSTSLDVLLKQKRVLLLGEAGYGKTYETINMLKIICTDERANNLLPIYLPLYEYGTIYSNIMDGIAYKIAPFCVGDHKVKITQWLNKGELVLLLDGIDDIIDSQRRTSFIAELRNLFQQFGENCFFVTSRANRYYNELDEIKTYYLRGVDSRTIENKLREGGIYVSIPKSYYELFANPLFFEVGKMILKQNSQRELFNRSVLFEELTLLLYGEWDQKKGIPRNQSMRCTEIITLLGEFAFNTFSRSSYSILEFETEVISLISEVVDKSKAITGLIDSGLLRISDRITFIHKLFKEYCTAFYLVIRKPLSENQELYLSLIKREEWKEVFIFAAGMYKEIKSQDAFLDFIMQNNLQLYVECINAKSDLYALDTTYNHDDLAMRYLSQMHHSYTYIISNYFGPIKSCFAPQPGDSEIVRDGQKVCIVGCLSMDKQHLTYWFDLQLKAGPDIILINDDTIEDCHKDHEHRAVFERRNISCYWINLAQSGLEGDTGRKIAINLIKSELKSIFEKRQLIESCYLLCERVDYYKKRINKIRNESDLKSMQNFVNQEIAAKMESSPYMAEYQYNGIDLFGFRDILCYLNQCNVTFIDCILPKEDKECSEQGSFVWDLYSSAQKENRISKFFLFHQLSYIEMVEKNFPRLYNSFSRYMDIPYQNVIYIDYNEERSTHDLFSEPIIEFYYVASPNEQLIDPEIRKASLPVASSSIFGEIQQSYLKKGKQAHLLSCTQTVFSFTTTSRSLRSNAPLSDYVYESIKESLEEIFGNLD